MDDTLSVPRGSAPVKSLLAPAPTHSVRLRSSPWPRPPGIRSSLRERRDIPSIGVHARRAARPSAVAPLPSHAGRAPGSPRRRNGSPLAWDRIGSGEEKRVTSARRNFCTRRARAPSPRRAFAALHMFVAGSGRDICRSPPPSPFSPAPRRRRGRERERREPGGAEKMAKLDSGRRAEKLSNLGEVPVERCGGGHGTP